VNVLGAYLVAGAALFASLGGTSIAADAAGAAKRLITGKEIRDGSVASKDIRDGSLKLRDFKASERKRLQGARGPAGQPGPAGPQGAAGPAGPVQAFHAARDTTGDLPAGTHEIARTDPLPAGSYVAFAKLSMDPAGGQIASCFLNGANGVDVAIGETETDVSLMGTMTLPAGGFVSIDCRSTEEFAIRRIRINVIPVTTLDHVTPPVPSAPVPPGG
jgi:hypothetical protein